MGLISRVSSRTYRFAKQRPKMSFVVKKAEIDVNKRAGQINEEELERISTTMATPKNFKIPVWFLNRQRDIKDGKDSQLTSNNLDNKLREDLERMKKVRIHRGIRH